MHKIADANTEKWARKIIIQAFKRVFNREPTLAEAQLAQAIGAIESGYGKFWHNDSHNWGAVTSFNKKDPAFDHDDSSPTLSGVNKVFHSRFRIYKDDIDGAAGMISTIFKAGRKQRKLSPKDQMPTGEELPGMGRGELCLLAAANGDITAFSAAMYYTGYYGGFGSTFIDRIAQHADAVKSRVNQSCSALGESPAVRITDNIYPVTSDNEYLNKLKDFKFGGTSAEIERMRKEKEDKKRGKGTVSKPTPQVTQSVPATTPAVTPVASPTTVQAPTTAPVSSQSLFEQLDEAEKELPQIAARITSSSLKVSLAFADYITDIIPSNNDILYDDKNVDVTFSKEPSIILLKAASNNFKEKFGCSVNVDIINNTSLHKKLDFKTAMQLCRSFLLKG